MVTDGDYVQTGREATLQMVAYGRLPSSLRAGESLRLDTLWVTRAEVGEDYRALLSLRGEGGAVVTQAEEVLVSGWAERPTSEWGAPEFHDVAFALEVPQDVAAEQYALWLEVAAPSGDDSACAPACRLLVDDISISP